MSFISLGQSITQLTERETEPETKTDGETQLRVKKYKMYALIAASCEKFAVTDAQVQMCLSIHGVIYASSISINVLLLD